MKMIDALESRRLMSVSLNAATHVLTINGTNAPDAITVDMVNGKVTVNDNGVKSSFVKANVSKIVAFGKGGNDAITLTQNVAIASELHSGSYGDPNGDQLQGGAGKDTIYLEDIYAVGRGGGGDDTILVKFGDSNVAYGQAGNDLVKFDNPASYGGDNGFDGGPGVDTIDYSGVKVGVVLKNGSSGPYQFVGGVPTAVGDVDGVAGFENFTGGQGNDYLYGTSGANTLRGLGGNDVIRGQAGDDKLFGGAGADALYGDDGNDFLQGDAGDDFLSAGTGADSLNGNDGNDVLYSKDGNKDFLAGGAGTDSATRDAIDVINSVEASQF